MTKAELRELWETRITEYKESGQSVRQWCADTGVIPHQLWYWLRKEKQTSEGTVSWLPVDLAVCDRLDSLLVRVGRATIDVRPGFDPKLLLDVVNTLSV